MLTDLKVKVTVYEEIAARLEGYAEGETELLPVLANAAAVLFEDLPDINWAGFYLMKEGELVLGPFQGKAAHMRIPVGKGVCGTAVKRDDIQIVADVHSFEGHIACDCASNSEIVLPIHKGGEILGVLDIDSPVKGRFDEEDAKGLRKFVKILENAGKEDPRGPLTDTWAAEAQDDLEMWIEEQGIQLRY